MTQPVAETLPAKTRKRSPAKTPSRQDDQKTKLTLYVPADLAKRFAVHATYSDMDRSALFAEMIREHCKRFIVSDRAKPANESIYEISPWLIGSCKIILAGLGGLILRLTPDLSLSLLHLSEGRTKGHNRYRRWLRCGS
jgi:hypothetical protein